MREFIGGGLYFRIWYRDREEPSVEPRRLFLDPDALVFLGKDLEPALEGQETWYFQDPFSYYARGAYPKLRDAEESDAEPRLCVYRLHEEDLNQVQDCRGLAKEVLECLSRRLSAGMSA